MHTTIAIPPKACLPFPLGASKLPVKWYTMQSWQSLGVHLWMEILRHQQRRWNLVCLQGWLRMGLNWKNSSHSHRMLKLQTPRPSVSLCCIWLGLSDPTEFSREWFGGLASLFTAMPQVTFRAPAKPRIQRAAFHGPPAWLSSAHYPLLYHFCSFAHIPVPDPVLPHVSCFWYSFCFMSPAPIPVLNPEPHSVLLCIMSPYSNFVSILLCLNPCLFPSTLLYPFRYLYVHNFLYVPQSEIDIDCPLWTPVCLIQTFRTLQKLCPSKLRTSERRVVKHQSLSHVLIKPCCWPSSSAVPESFRLPRSVSVCPRLVSVFNIHIDLCISHSLQNCWMTRSILAGNYFVYLGWARLHFIWSFIYWLLCPESPSRL